MALPSHEQRPESRIHESLSQAARIAYHGMVSAISVVRQENAQRTIERMEHKNMLYEHVGHIALTNETPRPDLRPQTFPERITAWQLERRAYKKTVADHRAERDAKVFGSDNSTLPKSVRQATVDRVLSLLPELLLPDYDSDTTISASVANNTKAVIFGPDVRGTTPLSKKLLVAKNNYEYFLKGQKHAPERREESYKIKSGKLKYGNKSHRKSRRMQRRANERFEHAKEMPITSRWRDVRIKHANKRAAKMQQRITERRQKIKDIRTQ